MKKHTGEDIPINFTLTDSNGDPIAISSLEGLAIFLVYDNGEVFCRHTAGSLSGTELIDILDDANGLVQIHVKREATSGARKGWIDAEVKIGVEDVDFTDSSQHQIQKVEKIFYMDGVTIRNQAI
jgi:hypothetical protein